MLLVFGIFLLTFYVSARFISTSSQSEQSRSCCGDKVCAEQHHHSARKVTTEPVSAKDLQTWYVASNEAYFDNKLPYAEVHWGDLTAIDDMGLTTRHANGEWVIIIDRRTNPTRRVALMTEFHEICHIKVQNDPDHGPQFQTCMLNLARAGAFAELW
jgi:hypothetical protein